MKQLIIANNDTFAEESNGLGLVLRRLEDNTFIADSQELNSNFAIYYKDAYESGVICIPEVDLKTLSVVKSEPSVGIKFKAEITVPTAVVVGKTYGLRIVKLGTVFNERSTWSFDAVANSTNGSLLAINLAKAINNNANPELRIKATASSNKLTIQGLDFTDYNVLLTEELSSVTPTITNAKMPVLDANFVRDLASRCAADKGFTDTYADGDSIYPGYPESVDDGTYDMFTLRFAVPRASAKQRDEVVYQTVHICVPSGGDLSSNLTDIFLPEDEEETA